jgi:bifunctional oligoribonuclease and PAP phosphatase NrnA
MTEDGRKSDRELVLDELRGADKLVVISHEHPDGDALGSLVAMQEVLTALGKESLMFIDPRDFPLPDEYGFLNLSGLIEAPPADFDDRTVVFLDCGNLERTPAPEFQREGACIVNIDHHHDNTRFGTVNWVVPEASCTAELVWELMHGLGVEPTPTIAEALYVGLITDTGRFMYENTSPRAHKMAAELIESGVDVNRIYHRVYEDVPYPKLALLARGLTNVERYDDGRLTVTQLRASDFDAAGAEESYSEGVIDYLRALRGTAVAALVRDRLSNGDGRAPRKVSLRATDERVDVSAIARAQGGGGHRQAAGFETAMSHEDLVGFLREQISAQL